MKYLYLFICTFFIGCLFAGVEQNVLIQTPFIRAQEQKLIDIYNKLNQNLYRRMPQLVFVKDDQLNAWNTRQGFIVFTDTIMREFTDVNELAGIMAHEMAHSYSNDDENMMTEDAADRLSVYFLLRAGYDVCKTREWVHHFQRIKPAYWGVDMTHPWYEERYQALTMPWCR